MRLSGIAMSLTRIISLGLIVRAVALIVPIDTSQEWVPQVPDQILRYHIPTTPAEEDIVDRSEEVENTVSTVPQLSKRLFKRAGPEMSKLDNLKYEMLRACWEFHVSLFFPVVNDKITIARLTDRTLTN